MDLPSPSSLALLVLHPLPRLTALQPTLVVRANLLLNLRLALALQAGPSRLGDTLNLDPRVQAVLRLVRQPLGERKMVPEVSGEDIGDIEAGGTRQRSLLRPLKQVVEKRAALLEERRMVPLVEARLKLGPGRK